MTRFKVADLSERQQSWYKRLELMKRFTLFVINPSAMNYSVLESGMRIYQDKIKNTTEVAA